MSIDGISIKEKIAYGLGNIAVNMSNIPRAMAEKVFTMQMGISPTIVSLCITLFTLWDMVTDPIAGWISDNTRSRWGRRIPYLFVGGLSAAALMLLFWFFDCAWSDTAVIAYFLVCGLLFFTAYTMWNMPYQCLLLEMTPDYDERTKITAFSAIGGKISILIMAWIWPATQMPIFKSQCAGVPDIVNAMRWLSPIIALIFLISCLLPAIYCKERYYDIVITTENRKEPFFTSFRKTLANGQFRLVLLMVVFMQLSLTAVSSVGIFLMVYYVFGGNQVAASMTSGIGLTISMVFGFISIPLIQKLSSKIQKHNALKYIIICKVFLSIASWWFYSIDYPWLILIIYMINEPISTGFWMLLPAMMADCVDYDELETQERREGSFASFFSLIVKIATAAGLALTGPLLWFAGFDAKLKIQSSDTLQLMRIMMMVIPAIGAVGMFWVLRGYNLSKSRVEEIKVQLYAQRRGQ